MKLYSTPPDWTSDHIETLRVFLETKAGKAMLERLQWLRPDFSISGDATERLTVSGRVEGYEECLTDLVALSFPPQNAEAKNRNPEYPSLEDDTAWPEVPLPSELDASSGSN